MKVKEVMMGTPYTCRRETNLAEAAELMWKGNCGFLPITGADNQVCGVITDRDICIALGTRNKLAGEVTAGEVTAGKLYACSPEDEIHMALLTMQEGRVRRLPVIDSDGKAVGGIVHGRRVAACRAFQLREDCGIVHGRGSPLLSRHQSARAATGGGEAGRGSVKLVAIRWE